MNQKIQLLPERLCNQIAAGEVVERPSSVVKELVENALDAGASVVRIDVEKGGRSLIRVTDDGSGMGREDAFLCLERHATSKIRSDEDLFHIHTLGFRGEALPSISAVSRLTLRTREKDSLEGLEIYMEGGTVKRADAVGMPAGTTIEVRNLFFNLPARRKFLRSEETELGHIGDVVTKLALARPDVQFRLMHNGKTLLDVYRHNSIQERVLALLGRTLAQDLVPLDRQDGSMSLSGLLSQPSATRSTSSAMFAFVNGRYVRDRVVQHALMEGYRNLLFKGRYPIAVLFLTVDPELVDVNVHPTKHEVRFREQSLVHDFIVSSVRGALRPATWLENQASDEDRAEPQTQAISVSVPGTPEFRLPRTDSSAISDQPRGSCLVREQELSFPVANRHVYLSSREDGPFLMPVAAEKNEPQDEGFFSSLAIIGQYRNSYILCQNRDDLFLIDQHAAHERIGFERLKAQMFEGAIEKQSLLFPETLELDFRESALLKDHLPELTRLGFDVEPFGGTTYVIKAVPQLLQGQDMGCLVRDLVGELGQIGKSGVLDEALDRVLIVMACHSMVRANQKLSFTEMEALLRELDTVDFKGHCPHGRPVMKRLAIGEIEKMFKRT